MWYIKKRYTKIENFEHELKKKKKICNCAVRDDAGLIGCEDEMTSRELAPLTTLSERRSVVVDTKTPCE